MEVEVRAGLLSVQKPSGLVKKYQKRYAALFRRSHRGVSRLELYDNKDGFQKRAKKHIISLDNCITIERTKTVEGKKHDLQIKLTFNDNKEQILLTETEQDKELWYCALSGVIFGGGALTDNMIYEQYEEDGYDVVIRENDLAKKLKLHGMYRLVVTDKNVELRDKSKTKSITAKWPLMLLRKYGRDKQEFSLEAGRRCESGPGMFIFMTDHYNEIFQEVDSKVRDLARNKPKTSSSIKSRKSPTVGNLPDIPPPHSPISVAEGEYADPRDQLLSPKPLVTEEPVYNEPVNSQPSLAPHKKGKKQLPGPPKPDRVNKNVFGDKKKRPVQPIEEATYSEAVAPIGRDLGADGGAYGSLDFEQSRSANGDDGAQYDSLNIWKGGKVNEGEYSTAAHVNQGSSVSDDSVYDHVKH